MKLRDKKGIINYTVRDPKTGQTWSVSPKVYLTRWQTHKVATRPDIAIQFAHFLEEQFKLKGFENVEVTAVARVSLNGRKHQLIIDPNIDLTMHKDSIMPAKWILPLVEPLKPVIK